MTRARGLLLGRMLALLQAAIWAATLSGTQLRMGWLLGLLAFAAAIAARRFPKRSAALLVGPAGFVALVAVAAVTRPRPALDVMELILVASLVLPAVIGAVLIWTATARSNVVASRTLVGKSRQFAVRRAVAAAILLAVLSIVPIALSFQVSPPAEVLANERWVTPSIDWRPMSALEALALATLVVLIGAVIGGSIGGLAWRTGRLWGGVAALASAWAASIVVMPLSAAALGIHLRTGIVCVFGCEALLRDDQPFSGPLGYATFLMGTATVAGPLLMLAAIVLVGVSVAAVLPRRTVGGSQAASGPPATGAHTIRSRIALLLALAGFAVVHGAGLALTATSGQTGLIPYVCLSVGVLAWTAWMDHVAFELPAPTPSDADVQATV